MSDNISAARNRKKPKAAATKKPRQERARHTIDALLQATAYILTHGGWDTLTTNRVAERAGVNIASLYQYFPGKDALVVELARRHVADQRAALLPILTERRGTGIGATLRALVSALVATHGEQPALHRALAEELPRLRSGHLDVDGELLVELARWLTTTAPGLPGGADAAWLAVTMAHAAIHRATEERPTQLDALATEIVALLTRALSR